MDQHFSEHGRAADVELELVLTWMLQSGKFCPGQTFWASASGYQLDLRGSEMMWQWQATNYEQVSPEQVKEFFFSSRVYESEHFQQQRSEWYEQGVEFNVLAGFAEPEESQAHLVVRRTVTEPPRRAQRRGEASISSDNAPLEDEGELSTMWREVEQILGASESEYNPPAEPRSNPEADLQDFDYDNISLSNGQNWAANTRNI